MSLSCGHPNNRLRRTASYESQGPNDGSVPRAGWDTPPRTRNRQLRQSISAVEELLASETENIVRQTAGALEGRYTRYQSDLTLLAENLETLSLFRAHYDGPFGSWERVFDHGKRDRPSSATRIRSRGRCLERLTSRERPSIQEREIRMHPLSFRIWLCHLYLT